MLRPLTAALLAAGLFSAALPLAAAPGHDHRAERAAERGRSAIYKAFFPNLDVARKAAVTLHGGLLETDYAGGWQVFELDEAGLALLARHGYHIEPAVDFITRRNAFLDAIDAANAQARAANPRAAEVGVQAIPGFACYETVEETFAVAQGFATSHPTLATWSDVGDSWEKSTGIGGYDMRVLKLTNAATGGAGDAAKPKLLITSAIHAREYVTAPLALAFARWLVEGHGGNADATWLLDHHEVHLLLQANPDGRKKAETGLSWRKNTNTAYCGATSNDRGVDLNRNFSFAWNSTNGEGSSGIPCDLTYRGPSAASEPETQSIEGYARSIWPDRRGPSLADPAPADTAGVHLDLHSYSELVLWPWGSTAAPAPNGTALQTLGRRFAWFNNYTPTQSIGLYPTDGTTEGASYGDLGVPHYTFELGTTFFQRCITYNNTIKPDNLQALIYAAKVARAPYQLPGGPETTALTLSPSSVSVGTPVSLTASLTDSRFNQSNGSETVHSIASAEAYIDIPPWLPGATPVSLVAADGAFDSATESAQAVLSTAGLAAGRHTVFVRGVDASGQAGPVSAAFVDIAGPGAINLQLQTRRRGLNSWDVTLTWSGAPGAQVDLKLNGAALSTTTNDGSHVDQRGRGTWTYRVCAAGSTSNCSPERTVAF